MRYPVEPADSSSVCMRSVAAALRGAFLDPFQIPPVQRWGLSLMAPLGPEAVRRAVGWGVRFRGTAPAWADRITADGLARWAVSLYAGLQGPFDAVLLGAPNGGVAHLAAALGVPFLSQHFLISFRDPTDPDDIRTYFDHGTALARRILQREPMVAVINHYDPLHDRYLVRWVNHIRLKLLDLPEAYRTFIQERLRPGGTLIFTDCRYSWLQYRVGPRHTFQVGGLGDVADREFLEGRPEIEAVRGAPGGWRLEGMPLEERPESEWGAEPPLREVVETFAHAHGYRFVALEGDHPEGYARLALEAHRWLSEVEGRNPQGTLVEVFTQTNPTAPLASRLLPLWLPFNCTDSLRFLQQMRGELPADRPVLLTPLSNFVQTFDTAGWEAYQEALTGMDLRVLGVRERLFPSDPAGLWKPARMLSRWCAKHPDPVRVRLDAAQLRLLGQDSNLQPTG